MEESRLNKPSTSREFYVQLVDRAENADATADLITLVSTLEGDALEAALPSLCLLAEKCPEELRGTLRNVAFDALADSSSSRGARKACFSCLKVLATGQPAFEDFFVLAECLEEPQFHIIRPVLPHMDGILASVACGTLPWKYASLVLVRALLHTNGWIRLWSLEKIVDVDVALMSQNASFLTSWLFPSLNANDLFWRLLERGRLTSFIEKLGQMLAAIAEKKGDSNERGAFLRSLLQAVENTSCPLSFYFIAAALERLPSYPVLGEEDFMLFRRAIKKAQYIQYISLKSATLYMLIVFIVKMTKWTPRLMTDIGSLTTAFSRDSPQLMEQLRPILSSLWKDYNADVTVSTVVEELMDKGFDYETDDDSNALLWLQFSLSSTKESQLLAHLSLCISELLSEEQPDSHRVDALLATVIHAPSSVTLDRQLVQVAVGYILMRVAIAEGKPFDFAVISRVYLPFLSKFETSALQRLPEAIFPSVCDSSTLSTERRAILCSVIRYIMESESSYLNNDHLLILVNKYLGTNNLLSLPRVKKSITSLSTKEFANITSRMHSDCLDLYLRLMPSLVFENDKVGEEAIEQLDCSSLYSVKERVLTVIERVVDKVSSAELQLSAVNAAACVVNEEKKSMNCLPAMSRLFRVAMQPAMMKNEAVVDRIESLVTEFVDTASLSVSISLVLANAMRDAEQLLTPRWANLMMRISVFGPVPKKENRVLSHAYEAIYSGTLAPALPSGDMDRLHEVVQRARLISLCVSVVSARRCSLFAHALTAEILVESSALDKSSSKSFGLSLAHRQKTRAVAVLLFVVEHVRDKAVLSSVFDHCIECILDPCQQFSIKLIVEWILVRVCLRDAELKEKLFSQEKELSSKRIGSVSSWLNTLVHLARVENNQGCFARLISLVLPWTTAQNFAVRCTAIAAAKIMFSSLSAEEQSKWQLVRGIIEFDSEPAGNSRRIIDNLCEDFYFSRLNMRDHFCLQAALIDIPLKTGMPPEETIPLSLMQKLNTTDIPSTTDDASFLDAPSLVYAALGKNNNSAPDIDVPMEDRIETESADSADMPMTGANLQRKIITKEQVRTDDCSLIVVASLIDKPNNLGGLCRTSEIFGVDRLILADMQLASDNGFKALSMSSEHWQKMEAVRPDQLVPYLDNLRANGYTVIAAEQTTDSVPLYKYKFPKKCALLMGDEKEGVASRLLRCVDQTVEIEQLGQTRSLNVHVTAALFIAKYAEQIMLQQ